MEGRPGTGKTTALGHLSQLLRDAGMPLCGFLTKELRQGRNRVGFEIETFDGERGVDLEAFERVALSRCRSWPAFR